MSKSNIVLYRTAGNSKQQLKQTANKLISMQSNSGPSTVSPVH